MKLFRFFAEKIIKNASQSVAAICHPGYYMPPGRIRSGSVYRIPSGSVYAPGAYMTFRQSVRQDEFGEIRILLMVRNCNDNYAII